MMENVDDVDDMDDATRVAGMQLAAAIAGTSLRAGWLGEGAGANYG